VDELAKAGLDTVPGVAVPCPRIALSPAALECRLHSFLDLGGSREVVLGEVVRAHLRADAVNEQFHVDPARIDAVGRMGGQGYASTRDHFDLPTMSEAVFDAGDLAARRRKG
jgi:flavin reductase (DIM6/NTAB) family NADH-FMN oxidoreductase RutF